MAFEAAVRLRAVWLCRKEVTSAASGSVSPKKMFFSGALTVTPLLFGQAAAFGATLGSTRLLWPRNAPELDLGIHGFFCVDRNKEGEASTARRNNER